MAVNKVDFGGNTLIDLTGDTLDSAEQLLKGIIAHAKDGSVITGLMEAGGGGGDYIVEKHVVTFAEEITCAAETSVELCDTAIQTPLCIGMITYANYAKGNVYVPAVSFGVGYGLINSTPTSGYALGIKDSYYTGRSQGYVRLYERQS